MFLATSELALCGTVDRLGGVARTADLLRAGHSRYTIASAVTSGQLRRVRRGWVASQDADPELVAAAGTGVALSCITQARRLGLWVLTEDRCHVAADPHRTGARLDRATVHWARALVPRAPGTLVDPIENVLALVAACQPFDAALAVWDSALQKNVVSADAMARLPLGPAARAILAEATVYSDSGIETIFRTRLRWLHLRILSQIWLVGHRVDFLLGMRLVVQIDGGHHSGAQRTADAAHDAELILRGYHVLRFSYRQIVDDWPAVQDTIMRAVAQGLHLAK